MSISINIFNSSSTKLLPKRKVIKVVNTILNDKNINQASLNQTSLNFIYLDDEKIHKMNNEFLSHDYPTDVITFNLDDNEGEIYIGVDVAKRQAIEYKVSLTNEILRLAIHGALHYVGYDDDTDEQRHEMRKLENKYLKTINQKV